MQGQAPASRARARDERGADARRASHRNDTAGRHARHEARRSDRARAVHEPDGTLDGSLSDKRFVGDELQRGDDAKFSVKDGAFVATIAGKKTVVAKVNGGQSAKRAVILVFLVRERQDLIDGRAAMKKAMADQQAELDKPCIPDPTKAPGNCLVTPMTEPPPPPTTRKPKKR